MPVYQLGIFSSWLDHYAIFDLRSWCIFALAFIANLSDESSPRINREKGTPTMNTESVTSETSGAAEQTTPKRKRAGKGKPAKQAAKAKTRTKKACKVAGSTSKSRDGSKTAMVLELLRRKDGGTRERPRGRDCLVFAGSVRCRRRLWGRCRRSTRQQPVAERLLIGRGTEALMDVKPRCRKGQSSSNPCLFSSGLPTYQSLGRR
jgi:hypothetical protein